MENSDTVEDPRWVRLHGNDNVVVLARGLDAGERLEIEGVACVLPEALGLGHKLATRRIEAGEKIVKYGVPIGSASEAIPAGAHVHLHNMKSDYLPTFTLETERKFGS